MKKILTTNLLIMLLFVTTASAVINTGNTTNNTSQAVSGSYSKVNSELSGYLSNKNYNQDYNSNNQSQSQSNMQGQVQGNVNKTNNSDSVNVEGDETEVLSYGAGSLTITSGTSGLNAGTPFGSIAIGNTERFIILATKNAMISEQLRVGVVDAATAKVEADQVLEQMSEECLPNRFCGFGYKTSGCNLSNLFGILSWKSMRKSDKL